MLWDLSFQPYLPFSEDEKLVQLLVEIGGRLIQLDTLSDRTMSAEDRALSADENGLSDLAEFKKYHEAAMDVCMESASTSLHTGL